MYVYVSFLSIGPIAISMGEATTLQYQNLKRLLKSNYIKYENSRWNLL